MFCGPENVELGGTVATITRFAPRDQASLTKAFIWPIMVVAVALAAMSFVPSAIRTVAPATGDGRIV